MAKKAKSQFVCQNCGYSSPKYLGKCPNCGSWNSMVEEVIQETTDRRVRTTLTGQRMQPTKIADVIPKKEPRVQTKLAELNRVLGGGVVPGSLILIGGDPGIGKSTLLLQVSQQLAAIGGKVLYVSGEESAEQIKMRAQRLGAIDTEFYLYPETDMSEISKAIENLTPDYVIIDSIQTMTQPDITSVAGSVSQVRETTAELLKLAKTNGIAIFIVGHVTKEGSIAGPRMLEHMVDTVLYFEGEKHHSFRILRAVKNRFGSTNEIGIFEMEAGGLKEVANPSQVLVEIQALVTPTMFGNAKRTTTGLDFNRVSLIMAVLEKRAGLLLQNQDAYLKAAGGVKLNEPAIDLAIAVSIASSYKEKGTSPTECFIGEIGLTGEIRRVNAIEQRVKEVQKLGFTKVYLPKNNLTGWQPPKGIEVEGVSTLSETLRKVFR